MNTRDTELDRLLRAAAEPVVRETDEMPFGFDTRVLAHWRSARLQRSGDLRGFARIFRRVAVGAFIVTTCAGAGAWWQIRADDGVDESGSNAYAITESAIDASIWQ